MSFILDNLIAAGRAKPMVVVMDQGYATRPGGPQRAGQPNVFDEVVIGDLIPAIDTKYRTLADRDHRAIAGLSMGAVQALQIGLTRMDLFSYVGAFSGAGRRFDIQTSYGGVFKDSPGFNRRMHLLWIGAGTAEEAIHRSSRGMHEELARAGINSVFIDSKGTAHEWQTWRKALHDFVPRLFKDSPTPD